MNNFSGAGRITKDHDVRMTKSGTQVLNFTIAINRDKENTDFINCVAFNKQAETMAQYTEKGNLIGITGRLQTSTYEGKNGETRYKTEVLVNNVHIYEWKKRDEEARGYGEVVKEEEVPF